MIKFLLKFSLKHSKSLTSIISEYIIFDVFLSLFCISICCSDYIIFITDFTHMSSDPKPLSSGPKPPEQCY